MRRLALAFGLAAVVAGTVGTNQIVGQSAPAAAGPKDYIVVFHDDERDVEVPRCRKDGGRDERRLTRERDAGRLEHHDEEDDDEAVAVEEVHHGANPSEIRPARPE